MKPYLKDAIVWFVSITLVTFVAFSVVRKPNYDAVKVCEAKGGILVRTYSSTACIKAERL